MYEWEASVLQCGGSRWWERGDARAKQATSLFPTLEMLWIVGMKQKGWSLQYLSIQTIAFVSSEDIINDTGNVTENISLVTIPCDYQDSRVLLVGVLCHQCDLCMTLVHSNRLPNGVSDRGYWQHQSGMPELMWWVLTLQWLAQLITLTSDLHGNPVLIMGDLPLKLGGVPSRGTLLYGVMVVPLSP